MDVTPFVAFRCPRCRRRYRVAGICDGCMQTMIEKGAMVRVKETSSRHPGKIGWFGGEADGEAVVYLNANRTRYIRVSKECLEPMRDPAYSASR